jgi:hypothetical protein
MDRNNHYEAAFEGYLQSCRSCYVAVDESRRTVLGDADLKNLDFIVFGKDNGPGYLIDVKGRQFPAMSRGRQRRVWECWSTHEDVSGLRRWEERFGAGYRSLLVFAYELLPGIDFWEGSEDLWSWRGRRYLFRAVTVDDYHPHMRVRSPRWGTVDLPTLKFHRLFRPFRQFLEAGRAPATECPF